MAGPRHPPELIRAMAEQMKLLIRDFVTAVTTHQLALNVNAADATDVSIARVRVYIRLLTLPLWYTQRVYGALYIQALEDMPGEYSSICGDLMKERPAALYAPSFTRLVIQRTVSVALEFQ